MSRNYEVGQFYLIGSMLSFIRVGDPKLIGEDYTADEAAEYVSGLSGYPGQTVPSGVRIFTSSRRKYSKKRAFDSSL